MKVLRIISIFVLTLFLLFLISILALFLISQKWERDFLSNRNEEHIFSEGTGVDSIDEKIVGYILSSEDVEFVEFGVDEIGGVLFSVISDSLGQDISLTEMYISPQKSVWGVCGRLEPNNFKSLYAWVCAEFVKENRETAQLYVSQLTLQGFKISDIFPEILGTINSGISNSLVTVNENGFVGRIYENIELLEDQVVIKGSLY